MKKFKEWLKKNKGFTVGVAMIIGISMVIDINKPVVKEPKQIQYSEFMQMVQDKKVDKVKINLEQSTFTFTDTNNENYVTDNPKDREFKKTLLESDVKVEEQVPTNMVEIITKLLSLGFSAIMVLVMLKYMGSIGKSKKASEPVNKVPDITFDKIAGNEEVKNDVKLLVDFLKNPKIYVESGAKMPRGVILYGDPGTGKTLTAKAIAGEAGVPFFSISGSDFVEMYVGVGAKRVRELFEQARKKAPCIIFIDEIDSIGGQRGEQSNSERDQTLNALLTEMDGFEGNEGILVIAATNRLDMLDKALIRTGRFDKHIRIPLPNQAERLEILKIHTKNKKLDESFSLEEVSKQTIGFSGSDLEGLVNDATLIAVSEGKKSVDKACVDKAFFQKLLKGHQKPSKDRQEDEIKLVAYHEAGHALVAKLITDYEVPTVTVIPSTSGTGGVTFTIPKKLGLMSKEELLADIQVRYGGRVAELLLLGDSNKVTTGAYNDIQQATNSIRNIITSYGMNDEIGLINLNMLEVNDEYIIKEASKLSKQLYEKTVELLTVNRDKLEKIATALMEKESLNEDDLNSIIKGTDSSSAVASSELATYTSEEVLKEGSSEHENLNEDEKEK